MHAMRIPDVGEPSRVGAPCWDESRLGPLLHDWQLVILSSHNIPRYRYAFKPGLKRIPLEKMHHWFWGSTKTVPQLLATAEFTE